MNIALSLGLTIHDLEYLEYGTVLDLMIEKGNNQHKYAELATQEDFDRF